MREVGCPRNVAVAELRHNGGDVVRAVLHPPVQVVAGESGDEGEAADASLRGPSFAGTV